MVLDKEGLFKELGVKREKVKVGKGEVFIAEIGATDYLTLWTNPELQTDGKPDMAKLRPALVARCVVNEEGERILTNDDAAVLAKSSALRFNTLADAAMKINGLVVEESEKK